VFGNEVLLPFAFPIHMGLHRIYHLATTLIHEGAAGCLRCAIQMVAVNLLQPPALAAARS
jgi:hypothetical protein